MTSVAPPRNHVRKGTPSDAPAVSSALAEAFDDDPVFSWMLPDETRRGSAVRAFFDVVVDALAVHDETWTTGAGVTGAALWVPYGRPPMSDERGERFVDELVEICGPHADRTLGLVDAMDEEHPSEPHEYLWFLGVVPASQGRGLGSTLMAPVLARADREGRPAYLEATTARNRAFYERHGFRARAPFSVADSPPLWPMWREPTESGTAGERYPGATVVK
ncbi:GNAT family N-acetyltransferase [Actinomycetospora sp. NBC_00405]|uniref:GNAT family N-acetyltransferase n=1 Tax=Actinomycetospora sp. NBC_00405 TaxID=2975952 RepID=UPI002E1F075C